MKKYKNSVNILSTIYSIFLIFGTSYLMTGSSKILFHNFLVSIILLWIIFLIIRKCILYLYHYLDEKKYQKENKKNNKFQLLLEKYPFLFSLGLILLSWLPYIISFYPVILSPDPSYQIKQYFKIPNKYLEYSIMLDENVTITNHHPVLHTLLLGTCLKLGNMIENDNLGLFLYSMIQILILSSVLAYTMKYMKNRKVPFPFIKTSLLIYSLIPMFPLYAMSAVKDVIYSSLMILYILVIYHFVKVKRTLKIREFLYILLLLILLILFRNNGFYIVLFSFPFLLINKRNKKRFLMLFICLILFYTAYNKTILPYFKITPSSIRETLSIPFQQTARYVKNSKLSKEEYEIYDSILDMDDLGKRYNPNLSDPVKNKYNKYTTKEELKKYFKYWFYGLLKKPGTYIEATINNVYGYFYPVPINWYVYYKFDNRITKDGFDYHYNQLGNVRKILSTFAILFVYIPILGFVSNIGFNTWILFFMVSYLLYQRKYKSIIYLMPALLTILVCIASPANAYFRYAMPYIFSMPLMIGLFIKEVDYEER